MRFEGNYDAQTDIAWLRSEGYDPKTVVSDEAEFGLREIDPVDGRVVGLEYWRASEALPSGLLEMLPAPPLGVSG